MPIAGNRRSGSGTLDVVRSLLLILWGWTFMGVLKDSDWGTVLGGTALCVVLVPLGVKLLKITHR